ncbi:MAG: transcriptional regulator MraZ [Candidatus Tectimicrobiota bacterium]|nr:MAG: transcriptional regulator MraZ [Candidatus Tectomicrobia bacterium]
MLLGEYRLSLDEKGRLSVPAAVRQTLHELYAPHDTTFVVTKYFEQCLVLYPKAVWLDIQAQLLGLRNDASTRAFLRQFCASASVCHLDRQGRLLIPLKLRQYAGIETEALLIGVLKKLELWSPARWEAYDASESARFDSHARLMELQL